MASMVRECRVNEENRSTQQQAYYRLVPTPPAHNFLDLIIANLLASIVGTMGIWLDAPFSFAHVGRIAHRFRCFYFFPCRINFCVYLNAGSASRTRDDERTPFVGGAIGPIERRPDSWPHREGRPSGYCTCGHAPYHSASTYAKHVSDRPHITQFGLGMVRHPRQPDRRAEREPWPMCAPMDAPVCFEPHNLYN